MWNISANRHLRTSRPIAGAVFALLTWVLPGHSAFAQQPASVRMGRAQLIAPAAADSYYASSGCHTYSLIDQSVCRTDLPAGYARHIDVRTAARALGAGGFTADQYVNAVYEFVKNAVDIESASRSPRASS